MVSDVLIQACIDKWGTDAQLTQAMEELAELIVAINKHKRSGYGELENLAEEIADVEIMISYLKAIASKIDCMFEENINEWKRKKLDRLEERLSKCDHIWVDHSHITYAECSKCGDKVDYV